MDDPDPLCLPDIDHWVGRSQYIVFLRCAASVGNVSVLIPSITANDDLRDGSLAVHESALLSVDGILSDAMWRMRMWTGISTASRYMPHCKLLSTLVVSFVPCSLFHAFSTVSTVDLSAL
jgi:hypothetical protein